LGLQGKGVEGIKILEEAQKDQPAQGESYFEIGRIYMQSLEVEAAVENIEKGLEKEPENAEGLLLFGEILFNYRSQPDEGLRAMRTAIRMDPGLPGAKEKLTRALLMLGVKAFRQKSDEAVFRIVEEILTYFPEQGTALKLRGQVYERSDEIEKGIEDFRRGLDLAPEDPEMKTLLARALIRKGYQLLFLKRREEALARFKEAVLLKARDVDVSVIAGLLEEEGDHRESLPDVDQEKIKKARTLFEEASACLEAGLAEDAFKKLERSLALVPENPYTLHQLGIALDMMQKPEEAEKKLKKALALGDRLNIRLPTTYLKIAELAIRSGRYEEGEAYLQKHTLLFPDLSSDPMAVHLRQLLLLKD
jgi:tetratricopeptide (TPR) repeat protein